MKLNPFILSLSLVLLSSCGSEPGDQAHYDKALENGKSANKELRRCQKYMEAWLEYADPVSGLFHGRMTRILDSEIALTSRIGHLPVSYSFSREDYVDKKANMESIIFGASEYVKDGLLPLTEYLGPSPWSERMIAITDDVWAHAPVQTEFGALPSLNVEVNGEQLQVLSRLYWMTGKQKYLEWAIRLGDYYLLGENHPTRDFEALRLNDHGCEIVSGLCELYATVHFAMPGKKEKYREAVHEMLDRILEVGRNKHGLFYVSVNPKTGEILEEKVRDNWGYNYNGYYTVYLLDGEEKYRDALLLAFSHLGNYRNYDWETGSADGFADAIEGCLNLYNREPLPEVEAWLDSETRVMWSLQWQNQGTTLHPWREDLIAGAVPDGQTLHISLRSEEKWEGRLAFDTPRSVQNMNLPLDWPRINQFPEWYVVTPGKKYRVTLNGSRRGTVYSGEDLARGLALKLTPGELLRIRVTEV